MFVPTVSVPAAYQHLLRAVALRLLAIRSEAAPLAPPRALLARFRTLDTHVKAVVRASRGGIS